ncbi:MAG TPA: electron transfer flavoprotein subunit beta/FixA family protein, partial [Candidatus Manganitrophaceae bacterium]|nr:electron transfer flavoprotein subunit beta/FixA family protein [Candidatus Manganitrophaceae bacterium]
IEKGPRIMKPADRNALEFALQLAEKEKGEVAVLTLAPPEQKGILKEALALGAERAVILSDPAFQEGDATSVAAALGRAVLKIKPDLVLCGEGQVGPRVAEIMKIGSVHSVAGVEADGGKAVIVNAGGSSQSSRSRESLPVLISVLPGSNTPRIANALKIMKASKKEITRRLPAEIGVSLDEIGVAGAGLRIARTFFPEGP